MGSGNTTIAVVDDHRQFRDMVVRVLSDFSQRRIFSFEDPLCALSHLEAGDSADIILSDINMPRMNGIDLLYRIKDKYPGKICILMSAEPSYETRVKTSGADAFLAKPFHVQDLLNLISGFIGRLENARPVPDYCRRR